MGRRGLRARRSGRRRRGLAVYDRLPADWRARAPAQVLFADLTLARAVAVAEAGALLRLRIRRTVEALGAQVKRALFGPEEPSEG